MTVPVYSQSDLQHVIGDDLLHAAADTGCCCTGGCCPNSIVLPEMADDPNATVFRIRITNVVNGADSCCLTPADIGSEALLTPSGPLFWHCCNLKASCITGITFSCTVRNGKDALVLSWKTDECFGLPANPVANEDWTQISLVCEPFKAIYRYTFTQAFPNPCNGTMVEVEITKF